MTSSKITLVFSLYLLGLGALFVLIPNLFLAVFFLPPTDEVWIRVVGMLVLILAWYYFCAARDRNTDFLKATIPGRTAVLVFLTAYVAVGLAEPVFILFGLIDAVFAFVTWKAMRTEAAVRMQAKA